MKVIDIIAWSFATLVGALAILVVVFVLIVVKLVMAGLF
jgi:hypothetical protein